MFFGMGRMNTWMIILVILLVVENLSYYISTPGALLGLVLSIPGVLIAITFHEFAHAWMADKLGDDTPRRQGRLNLNPLSHMDPVGIAMLLFAGFGWGKPVEINQNNFNRTVSLRKGNALVSLAGPVMNFILAIIFSIIYAVFLVVGKTFLLTTAGGIVSSIILSIISMNVGLGVFNLIPLPPLDGSKIFLPILPHNAKSWFIEHEQTFYFIFLIIWITGIAGRLISPIIGWMTNQILGLAMTIFKIS